VKAAGAAAAAAECDADIAARANANITRANVISNAGNRLQVGRRRCLLVQSLSSQCRNQKFIFLWS